VPGKPPPEKQCTADSKRTGRRCEAWAVARGETCYHHGGASRSGIAHPNFKHGRHSKALKGVNLDYYQEALEDPQIQDLVSEIALTDVLINRTTERLGDGESFALMGRLRKEWAGYGAAQRRGDNGDAAAHLDRLGDLIDRGASLADQVEEISRLVDRRRKLSASHHRQLVNAEQQMGRAEVMALVAALVSAVKRNVTDAAVLSAIQADIGAAIGKV
jgi:hypothetical protein